VTPKRTKLLTCHAPHPDVQRRKGDACGRSLVVGEVPAALEFVTISDEAPAMPPDGTIWVQCPRKQCGKWNRFRIVVERGSVV
jgi:hypothetical protein